MNIKTYYHIYIPWDNDIYTPWDNDSFTMKSSFDIKAFGYRPYLSSGCMPRGVEVTRWSKVRGIFDQYIHMICVYIYRLARWMSVCLCECVFVCTGAGLGIGNVCVSVFCGQGGWCWLCWFIYQLCMKGHMCSLSVCFSSGHRMDWPNTIVCNLK